MDRKSRKIHNAQPPMDSAFSGSPSCVKKTFATAREVYVRDHRLNSIWAEGIIRALLGSMLCELNVGGQTWVRYRNHFHLRCAAKWLNPKTAPLDVILDVFDLPPLGNSGTPEIQSSNQQKCSRESLLRFQIDPTSKS